MAAMLETFTPEQLRRYEHFRRSHLRKTGVRSVMSEVTSLRLTEKLLVTMGGVAKVFAGELVEMARSNMDDTNDHGPIRPRHLRAAFHKMAMKGQLPYFRSSKHLLR
jgi:transcription initiation factor TFIID subunit 11